MSATESGVKGIESQHFEDSNSLPLLDRIQKVLANPNHKGENLSHCESTIVLVGCDDLLTASRERVLQSAGFVVISRTVAEELMLNPPGARDLTILTEAVDPGAAEVILARVCDAGFATVVQILDPWEVAGHIKMRSVILSSELTSPGKLIAEVRSILAHYRNRQF